MLTFLAMIDNEVIRNHLEEIYHLYKKDLLYVANDILKDQYEAEDVVQTAFIKISVYLDEKTDVKCNKTKGLIVLIVRNLAINIYNQRKRRMTVVIDELDDVLHDKENMNPELHVLRLDKSEWIARQLAEIKSEYADILSLKYGYEYTNKELADMLCISEGNVRVKLVRARKALQTVLGGKI